MTHPLHHSRVTRFFIGEDDNVGPDLQTKISMIGPNDPDASGVTPEESTEDSGVFAIQFRDSEDAAVFVGEPYRICVMLEEALELARAVAREQAEDSE